MKSKRICLVLAAGAFLAWIGWLVYLAVTTTHPVVLSRPQFLGSDLDVIALVGEVDNHPDPSIEVVEVYWPKAARDQKFKQIRVTQLSKLDKQNGWDGPGRYILPLAKGTAPGSYDLARIPRSPGYPSRSTPPEQRLRIYPENAETRSQLARIRAGEWD